MIRIAATSIIGVNNHFDEEERLNKKLKYFARIDIDENLIEDC